MKKITILTVFLFSFVLGVQGVEAQNLKRGDPFIAKCIKVYDGDTVTVQKDNGEKLKIRIYGIDAPELKQEYGVEARTRLEYLVLNQEVLVVPIATDRYQRTVAMLATRVNREYRLFVDIGYEMIANGAAWYAGKYCNEEEISECLAYKKAQEAAEIIPRGLFERKNIINPEIYRKKQTKIKKY